MGLSATVCFRVGMFGNGMVRPCSYPHQRCPAKVGHPDTIVGAVTTLVHKSRAISSVWIERVQATGALGAPVADAATLHCPFLTHLGHHPSGTPAIRMP